jgi:hypothetical protein
MSMNWIWCLNHNIPQEEPSESPTPTFDGETKNIDIRLGLHPYDLQYV